MIQYLIVACLFCCEEFCRQGGICRQTAFCCEDSFADKEAFAAEIFAAEIVS